MTLNKRGLMYWQLIHGIVSITLFGVGGILTVSAFILNRPAEDKLSIDNAATTKKKLLTFHSTPPTGTDIPLLDYTRPKF